MNVDDERIDGVTLLSAPPPRVGFWAELHEELAAITDPSIDDAGPFRADVAPSHRPRRVWVAATAAAAAIAFLVAGFVMIEAWRDDRPELAPADATQSYVAIDDPMAIDLDSWATDPPVRGAGPFTVFDLQQLPAGWTVPDAPSGAHVITDLDPSHYRWTAGVVTDDGRVVYLSAETDDEHGPSTDGSPVDVHGRPGLVDDDILTWIDATGARLSVFSSGATPDELVGIADALTVTSTDTLTAPDVDMSTDQADTGETRLAGTIAGVRWDVTSAADAATSLSVKLDGRLQSSGGGAGRPSDSTTWDVVVTGLGERGVILYGLAPADVVNVRVRLDATAIELPVAHDTTGATIFAIPIPPSLHIRSVELIDADGQLLHSAALPRYPTPSGGTSARLGEPFGDTSNAVIAPNPDE